MRIIFVRHGDPDYANDTLTEKGWEIHSIMEGAVDEAEAKLMFGLSGEEIEQMYSLLARMRRNLE